MKTKLLAPLLSLNVLFAGASLFVQSGKESASHSDSPAIASAPVITPEARAEALAAADAGRNEAAEPVLIALSQRDPVDAEACRALAKICIHKSDAKTAVTLLERATAAYPTRADLQLEYGNALARRIGQVAFMQQAVIAGKMRGAFEKTVSLDPSNVGGWIGLAQYCMNAPEIAGGGLDKAESYAKEVEKRDPFEGAVQLGLLAQKRGDLSRMQQELSRASELKPSDPWAYVTLGYAYLNASRLAEAKTAFENALKRKSDCEPAKKGLRKVEEMGNAGRT